MTLSNIQIIAEAGVNHNGSIKKAMQLIDVAAHAKADFVKFQHTNPNKVSLKAPLCPYQRIGKFKNQKDMINSFHLNWEQAYPVLIKHAKKKNIKFMQTFYSAEDFISAKKYNLNYIKVASSDIINVPLLKIIAQKNKRIFLSTGMANLNEIKNAIKILIKNGATKKNITLFHCVSAYPTPIKNLNLNSIPFLRGHTNLKIGFSDHSEGEFASAIALTLGCKIIEKHFTLDKSMKGPDHKLSLSPKELKHFVNNIKDFNNLLGFKRKKCELIEKENKFATRQSVHAIKNIKKGDIFNNLNIALKRPASGASPSKYMLMLGAKAKKNYNLDDPVK
jgi:N,N'-diacetyllegionaminate synthase